MIKKIKDVLAEFDNIDDWKINVERTEAREYFFIKQEMDMARGKEVDKYELTVYRDFMEENNKFRGSSTSSIYPTMNKSEIRKVIKEALFAAEYARSEYYPLVENNNKTYNDNDLHTKKDLNDLGTKLSEQIFEVDTYNKGWINSAELFLNNTNKKIINSKGVNVEYSVFNVFMEIITNWQENNEEVELFKTIEFANIDYKKIKNKIDKMLKLTGEKARARSLPDIKNIPVLLTGNPVRKLLDYYYMQANAKLNYEKLATAEKDQNIQGNEIKGDKINLELKPLLAGSTKSTPYDSDGYPLKEVKIYENGILDRYWGRKRYSYYLNEEATGRIENKVFSGGSKSVDKMKEKPYLELLAFSNFQMDPITGNFGGEIRLGRYYDGDKIIPVSGGSISGNILKTHQNMYLSEELQEENNFIGPETIEMKDINIAGR